MTPNRALVKYYTGPETTCNCGEYIVPDNNDRHNWYWQIHSTSKCTLELPDLVCWCGLLRSKHVEGHAPGSRAR